MSANPKSNGPPVMDTANISSSSSPVPAFIYSIENVNVYRSSIVEHPSVLFEKYTQIINEYFIHSIESLQHENIHELQTYHDYKYILKTGFNGLTYVFKVLLLYTRNLELTYFHAQKAIYYYIEFIHQISNDVHVSVQLTPKDALLFIYKKTIFQIQNDYRHQFVEMSDDFYKSNILSSMISIYTKVIFREIDQFMFTYDAGNNMDTNVNTNVNTCRHDDYNNVSSHIAEVSINGYNASLVLSPQHLPNISCPNVQFIKTLNTHIHGITDSMIRLSSHYKTYDDIVNAFNKVDTFVDVFMTDYGSGLYIVPHPNGYSFYSYIEMFIKKVRKNDVSTSTTIMTRMHDGRIYEKYVELTPLKFINWVFHL